MFMTSTENQRETFWKVFDKVLKENGEPFKISYVHKVRNEITTYASVNRKSSFNANSLNLNFLLKEKRLRVELYVTSPILMRKFMGLKEEINSMVSLPIVWDDGKRVLRPSVYFEFLPDDEDDYKIAIEESLSTILEFIEVANKYGKGEFFDF